MFGARKPFKSGFDCLSLLTVAVEWVDTQHRIAVTILMSLDWTAFAALLPAMAYFFTEWRVLTAAATSQLFLGMICWWYGVGVLVGDENKNFQLLCTVSSRNGGFTCDSDFANNTGGFLSLPDG